MHLFFSFSSVIGIPFPSFVLSVYFSTDFNITTNHIEIVFPCSSYVLLSKEIYCDSFEGDAK